MLRLSVVVLILTVIGTTAAFAAVPKTISYQGLLKDDAGGLVPDGWYLMTFRLYDISEGGTPLWTQVDSLHVVDGIFNTILGSAALNLAFDRTYWLSIEVEAGGELSPRIELAASPYAFRAAVADSAASGGSGPDTDWQYSGDNIYRTTGNVGIGSATPTARLEVASSATHGIRSTVDGESGKAAIIAITSTDGCQAIDATANCDGFGVRAHSLEYIGIGGFTASESQYGVYGFNQVSGNFGWIGGGQQGVYGAADDVSDYGVYGRNPDANSTGYLASSLYGVYGSGATGVYGTSTQLEGVSGYTSGSGSKGVYGEHSSGNYGWLGDDYYGVYGYSAAGYAGYFQGKAKVTSNLEVGNMGRILGSTWPSSGRSMELGYSSSFHKGYIQAFDRDTGAWGDLYLGSGKVGIGTGYPARTLHVNDVMRLEPRADYPSSPADGDLCIVGAAGSRHLYCYLNGGWRQLD